MVKKIVTIAAGILLGLLAGYYAGFDQGWERAVRVLDLSNGQERPDESDEQPNDSEPRDGVFRDAAIGLAFSYPVGENGYVLTQVTNTDDITVRALTLMTKAAYDELLESDAPREGPPAILVQVYNPGPNVTPNDWIVAEGSSNYEAGTPLENITVAGNPAIRYSWDGLYRGETVVVARKGWVYVFTVTYQEKTTQPYTDFDALLKSVELLVIE